MLRPNRAASRRSIPIQMWRPATTRSENAERVPPHPFHYPLDLAAEGFDDPEVRSGEMGDRRPIEFG
ncbi:MAG: hypothetical protein ACT4QB_22795 [Gammaproteobacteria bacterium]